MSADADPTARAVAGCAPRSRALHAELARYGLVVWTAGNVSARVPGADLLVIKPSGVAYDELDAEAMVVCDLDGDLVEGDRAPVVATPPPTPTSTGTCPRSAASCTPTPPTRPPGRPAASRSRACSR